MFEILFLAAIVILPIYLTLKAWRWSASTSKINGKAPWSVSLVEASTLAILTSVMVIHVASGGTGLVTSPLQEFIIRERILACAIMIAVAGCWILLGLWKSISLAAVGMLISISMAMTFASSKPVYERFEKEIRQIPVPIEA